MKELPNIIKKRYQIAQKLNNFFLKNSKIFTLQAVPETSIPSYYFLTIEINCNQKKRVRIINLLKKNGIGFNEKHRELVYEWKWINKYTTKKFKSLNALNYRKKTINLYFNEKYSKKDVNLLLHKFLLVEKKVS